MEKINSSEFKSKSIGGWIFGGLSFIPLVGVFFGIIAIIFGIYNKIKGQIYLGIAGIFFTILIYGSLIYFSIYAKAGPFEGLKIKLTSQVINTDAGQILLYKNEHGVLPTKLSDISISTTDTTKVFVTSDPWTTELQYTVQKDGGFELRSAGPDKVFNTNDDISQIY